MEAVGLWLLLVVGLFVFIVAFSFVLAFVLVGVVEKEGLGLDALDTGVVEIASSIEVVMLSLLPFERCLLRSNRLIGTRIVRVF